MFDGNKHPYQVSHWLIHCKLLTKRVQGLIIINTSTKFQIEPLKITQVIPGSHRNTVGLYLKFNGTYCDDQKNAVT